MQSKNANQRLWFFKLESAVLCTDTLLSVHALDKLQVGTWIDWMNEDSLQRERLWMRRWKATVRTLSCREAEGVYKDGGNEGPSQNFSKLEQSLDVMPPVFGTFLFTRNEPSSHSKLEFLCTPRAIQKGL